LTDNPNSNGVAALSHFSAATHHRRQQGAAPDRLQLRSFLAALSAAGELGRSALVLMMQGMFILA